MSRIHEALKRAEQERVGAPAQAHEPRHSTVAVAEQPVTHAPDGAIRPANFSFEEIARNCRRADWRPDLRTMVSGQGRHTAGAEEFRTLRSRLYKIREQQTLKSVLITSPLPAEGKTFVAANLAFALSSQKERKVILLDADLRKPRAHVLLGAPPAPGLTDYLGKTADEFAVIQRGNLDNLFFIPGGNLVANPADLIGGERMAQLMQRLTAAFDWVIVDTPPTIPVSDAHVLSSVCDGSLLVVMAGATPLDLAQKAAQQFHDRHMLGAILNRAERGTGYHSNYYYEYGYGESGREA